jgi:hypothetical protein
VDIRKTVRVQEASMRWDCVMQEKIMRMEEEIHTIEALS